MTESMHGKVAVVARATSGIGRASALDLPDMASMSLHRVGVVLCRTLNADDKLVQEEINTTLRPFVVRLVHPGGCGPAARLSVFLKLRKVARTPGWT